MEEIEYLEEYEELVLPAINTTTEPGAEKRSACKLSEKLDKDDDSSSSLDQDIFNCLFDDNSEDENTNQEITINPNTEPSLKQTKTKAKSEESRTKFSPQQNFLHISPSQLSPSSPVVHSNKKESEKINSFNPRPATIVKPEKIITKDPIVDPLNLDELSSAESANYSVSDISGETYNSISDLDDDECLYESNCDNSGDESSNSPVIDISNDSSESLKNYEKLRCSTPSPVVSEDREQIKSSATYNSFMSNPDIIKGLLLKERKPKLLQLIQEHDKTESISNADKTKEQNMNVMTTARIDDQFEKNNTLKSNSEISQDKDGNCLDTCAKNSDDKSALEPSDVNEVGAEMEVESNECRPDFSILERNEKLVSHTEFNDSSENNRNISKAQAGKYEQIKSDVNITKRQRKKRFRNLITPEIVEKNDDNCNSESDGSRNTKQIVEHSIISGEVAESEKKRSTDGQSTYRATFVQKTVGSNHANKPDGCQENKDKAKNQTKKEPTVNKLRDTHANLESQLDKNKTQKTVEESKANVIMKDSQPRVTPGRQIKKLKGTAIATTPTNPKNTKLGNAYTNVSPNKKETSFDITFSKENEMNIVQHVTARSDGHTDIPDASNVINTSLLKEIEQLPSNKTISNQVDNKMSTSTYLKCSTRKDPQNVPDQNDESDLKQQNEASNLNQLENIENGSDCNKVPLAADTQEKNGSGVISSAGSLTNVDQSNCSDANEYATHGTAVSQAEIQKSENVLSSLTTSTSKETSTRHLNSSNSNKLKKDTESTMQKEIFEESELHPNQPKSEDNSKTPCVSKNTIHGNIDSANVLSAKQASSKSTANEIDNNSNKQVANSTSNKTLSSADDNANKSGQETVARFENLEQNKNKANKTKQCEPSEILESKNPPPVREAKIPVAEREEAGTETRESNNKYAKHTGSCDETEGGPDYSKIKKNTSKNVNDEISDTNKLQHKSTKLMKNNGDENKKEKLSSKNPKERNVLLIESNPQRKPEEDVSDRKINILRKTRSSLIGNNKSNKAYPSEEGDNTITENIKTNSASTTLKGGDLVPTPKTCKSLRLNPGEGKTKDAYGKDIVKKEEGTDILTNKSHKLMRTESKFLKRQYSKRDAQPLNKLKKLSGSEESKDKQNTSNCTNEDKKGDVDRNLRRPINVIREVQTVGLSGLVNRKTMGKAIRSKDPLAVESHNNMQDTRTKPDTGTKLRDVNVKFGEKQERDSMPCVNDVVKNDEPFQRLRKRIIETPQEEIRPGSNRINAKNIPKSATRKTNDICTKRKGRSLDAEKEPERPPAKRFKAVAQKSNEIRSVHNNTGFHLTSVTNPTSQDELKNSTTIEKTSCKTTEKDLRSKDTHLSSLKTAKTSSGYRGKIYKTRQESTTKNDESKAGGLKNAELETSSAQDKHLKSTDRTLALTTPLSKAIQSRMRKSEINKSESPVFSNAEKQDKKLKLKRSELDMLKASMSKELKDAGINDLVHTNGNDKRQRLVDKRKSVPHPGNKNLKVTRATASADTLVANELHFDKSSMKPPEKLGKKSNIKVFCSQTAASTALPIEMEKALIDDAEIKNMKFNLLRTAKGPRQRNEKNTNNQHNLNKTMRGAGLEKCRRLRVRLSRKYVNEYLRRKDSLKVVHSASDNQKKKASKKDATSLSASNGSSVAKKLFGPRSTQYPEKTTPKEASKASDVNSNLLAIEPTPTSEITNNEISLRSNITAFENLAEAMIPVELKNEFLDENPSSLEVSTIPDTSSLMARAHNITQATASALTNSILPTDIRLLTNDPLSSRSSMPSFGVTPTVVDAKGTLLYTFLHPAKYSRNHGFVLLDYCCPNLDGPMSAIDPTRIHSQIQTPVIELPSCIVLTTKVVTRAQLESNLTLVPAVIRKKAEKLRNNLVNNQGINMAFRSASDARGSDLQLPYLNVKHSNSGRHNFSIQNPTQAILKPPLVSPDPFISPSINALAKYLPSTTTITAKIRPPHVGPSNSIPALQNPTNNCGKELAKVVTKQSQHLNDMDTNLIRSNLHRIDTLLKSIANSFKILDLNNRNQIIENMVSSGKFVSVDLETTIALMEEYNKQINLLQTNHLKNSSACSSLLSPAITPQLGKLSNAERAPIKAAPGFVSSTSKIGGSENSIITREVKQMPSTTKQQVTSVNTVTMKKRQVPIYDTERNVIGYQLQVIGQNATATQPITKSVANLSGEAKTSPSKSGSNRKAALKRPIQGSPQIFYTSQALQSTSPRGTFNAIPLSTSQQTFNTSCNTTRQTQNGSIMATLMSGETAGTETITTTTVATVKRVTRSRAAGSKIIIESKSSSNEETILPDVGHQTEIKHENELDDFVG